MNKVIVFVAALACAGSVVAQERFFGEGGTILGPAEGARNVLYDACATEEQSDFDYSLGFVMGVVHHYGQNQLSKYRDKSPADVRDDPPKLCIPPGVFPVRLRELACKYVKEHPELSQRPPDRIVVEAVVIAFPCAEFVEWLGKQHQDPE